jgi:hypothetical protein
LCEIGDPTGPKWDDADWGEPALRGDDVAPLVLVDEELTIGSLLAVGDVGLLLPPGCVAAEFSDVGEAKTARSTSSLTPQPNTNDESAWKWARRTMACTTSANDQLSFPFVSFCKGNEDV